MRVLELATDLSFVVLALAALMGAARRPERSRVDVALLFGALGGAALIQEVPRTTGAPLLGGPAIALVLVLALPLLLVRLVDNFHDVPAWLPITTLVLFVALAGLAIVVQPLPLSFSGVAVAYLIAGELYAAAAFIRRARPASGITGRRMAAAALGCGLLAVAFALGVAEQAVPPEKTTALAASEVVALVAGLCFWAGFFPPAFLRQSWRLPALFAYLRATRSELDLEDSNAAAADAASIGRLLAAATQTTGGRRALLALEDTVRGDLFLWGSPSARLAAGEGLVGQAVSQRRVVFARRLDPGSLAPSVEALFSPDQRPRSAIVAPVMLGAAAAGALALFADKGPIFLEDDLDLVSFFATEASAILRARQHREAAQELAALREADRLKDEFMAVVSHELRTPLTAITGYADILLRGISGPLNERQQRHVQGVRDAAGRLLGLINDLLDVSKLEAGTLDLHRTTVDPQEAVVHAAAAVRVIAATKHVRLEANGAAVPAVQADEARLQQILVNLLTNAVKFTPEGGTVSVAARAEEAADGSWIVIGVSDTGVGIAPGDLARVWDRFYQIDSSSSRRFGGAGLGLSIVRRLAELHGGRVTVASPGPGQGSTFEVWLPAATAPTAAAPAVAPPTFATVGDPGEVHRRNADRLDVLVVEDDPDIAAVLRTYLEDDGYAVHLATDGHEAVRLARELHPAAIALDIMLPKLDGWSVLNALKREPTTCDIPVIVVSIVDNKDFGVVLGAADYLVKPIEQSRLRTVVERLAGRPRLSGGPILLVDDDQAIVDVLETALKSDGWAVRTAGDGERALAQVESERPLAVILDLMMPGMDGFDVIQALRENPAWRDIPVVIMTARDLTDDDRERLVGRVQRIILKQALSVDSLQHQIAEALAAFRDGRQAEPASSEIAGGLG